jgi:hypothetical protein
LVHNASGLAELDQSIILGNQLDDRANRGVSDFDRTHRFVLSYLWDLPQTSNNPRLIQLALKLNF